MITATLSNLTPFFQSCFSSYILVECFQEAFTVLVFLNHASSLPSQLPSTLAVCPSAQCQLHSFKKLERMQLSLFCQSSKTWKQSQEGGRGHIISIEKTVCSPVPSLDLKEQGKRWTFVVKVWISKWMVVMCAHKHHLIPGLETLKSHPQHFWGNNYIIAF